MVKRISPQCIQQLLNGELPGARSHRKMLPPGRELTVSPADRGHVRYSSVLLLLFPVDGKVYTCLTRRNLSMRNHPGQVSLPGGRIEQGESPEVTALREAHEEVGISPPDVTMLGRLSELYVQVSRYTIFPYVGWTEKKPDFVLNQNEAEKLILLPIREFMEKRRIEQVPVTIWSRNVDVPGYSFDGEVIWGATAMILAEFFDILGDAEPIIF